MGTCFFPNFYPSIPPNTSPQTGHVSVDFMPHIACIQISAHTRFALCTKSARMLFLSIYVATGIGRGTNNGRNFYKKTTPYCEREKIQTVVVVIVAHFLGTKTVFFSFTPKSIKIPQDKSSFPGWLLTVFISSRQITAVLTATRGPCFFYLPFVMNMFWVFFFIFFSLTVHIIYYIVSILLI